MRKEQRILENGMRKEQRILSGANTKYGDYIAYVECYIILLSPFSCFSRLFGDFFGDRFSDPTLFRPLLGYCIRPCWWM